MASFKTSVTNLAMANKSEYLNLFGENIDSTVPRVLKSECWAVGRLLQALY